MNTTITSLHYVTCPTCDAAYRLQPHQIPDFTCRVCGYSATARKTPPALPKTPPIQSRKRSCRNTTRRPRQTPPARPTTTPRRPNSTATPRRPQQPPARPQATSPGTIQAQHNRARIARGHRGTARTPPYATLCAFLCVTLIALLAIAFA